jgi:replicative DNA helicase
MIPEIEQEFVLQVSPPHVREFEESVLGGLMIAPECISQIRGIVNNPKDFFIIRHRWIWEAMCRLDDKRAVMDILTIGDEMGEKLSESGGASFLTSLINQCPTSLNIEDHARRVHESGVRRRVIEAANQTAQAAYDIDLPITEVISRSLEAVQIAANGLIGGRSQTSADLAGEHYSRTDEAAKRKEMPGIPTGFPDLDILLGGGLQDDDFSIVAAFTGGGKTSFLDTVATYIAKTKWVSMFTLEMSNIQQSERILSQMSGINSQRLRGGKLTDEEWPVYTHAIEEFSGLKLNIDDTVPLSIPTLRAKCMQMKSQGKLDVVILDYAGLMESIGATEYDEHRRLSRGLKQLARELHVPLFAAHQLNRKGTEYETPTMHHLRGSGTWEQDADIVMLVYENKNVVCSKEFKPRRLDINKQRNGPVGYVDLLMRSATTKFENGTKNHTMQESP